MTDIPLRDPAKVMRLARLGSMHQSRLSFMRILTRRMAREDWRFEQSAFYIDEKGVGHAVYTAHGPHRAYSLVAFAHDLPPEKRSDRVIADAWDATFTLFDGIPSAEDIERLSRNVPLQEAGRISGSELSLSRANRSVRLWEYVVATLAAGRQPSVQALQDVGYLMRTTAVYGSGKFGAADREMIDDRPEFSAPFQVEMLSVYLTRWFVIDLVQHMADARARENQTQAAQFDPDIARTLGIGNSTGLGMAPFLLNHPNLFHNWIAARENALRDVRAVPQATPDEITLFRDLVHRNAEIVASWQSEHPIQIEKLDQLRTDINKIKAHLNHVSMATELPWDALYRWAEQSLSLEGQEWIASLMLEPYGHHVDAYATDMALASGHPVTVDGAMRVGRLREILQNYYGWALATDWSDPSTHARAWYVSEEKLEPRLGERFEEPIEAFEQPLSPGRDAARAFQDLEHWNADAQVADFLLRHPEHRHAVRRAQIVGTAQYAEIQDNTISDRVLPIDMLRCKLSFFGATKFDPRSDRWVRICMYGNAPFPQELNVENADFWVFPPTAKTAA